jgi:hypothetical protein
MLAHIRCQILIRLQRTHAAAQHLPYREGNKGFTGQITRIDPLRRLPPHRPLQSLAGNLQQYLAFLVSQLLLWHNFCTFLCMLPIIQSVRPGVKPLKPLAIYP